MEENYNNDNEEIEEISVTPLYDGTEIDTDFEIDTNYSISEEKDFNISIDSDIKIDTDVDFDMSSDFDMDISDDSHLNIEKNTHDISDDIEGIESINLSQTFNSNDEISYHDITEEFDSSKIDDESVNSVDNVRRAINKVDKSKKLDENKASENNDLESKMQELNQIEDNIEKVDVSGYQFRDVTTDDIMKAIDSTEEDKEKVGRMLEESELADIATFASRSDDGSVTGVKKSKRNKKDKNDNWFRKLPKRKRVAIVIASIFVFLVGGSVIAYNTVLASLINFKDFSKADEQKEEFDTKNKLGDNLEVVNAEDFNWDIIKGSSMYDPNIYNILIIGGDTTSKKKVRGNSDTLMIVSIDKNTKKLKMTSIMRDVYVPIPEHSANKVNSAFATGGVPLVKQTIEENFKVSIDSTVVINYTTFVKVINKLGGLDDVIINEKEAAFINKETMLQGYKAKQLKAGTVHMDAHQALNFARIRKISSDIYGDNDFGRTARQRFIMNQLFKKYRNLSYTELAKLATMVLGELEVDVNLKKDMFLLLQVVLKFDTSSIEEFRVPVDGAYTFADVPVGRGHMNVVKIDDYWQENIDALHMFIYGNVEYDGRDESSSSSSTNNSSTSNSSKRTTSTPTTSYTRKPTVTTVKPSTVKPVATQKVVTARPATAKPVVTPTPETKKPTQKPVETQKPTQTDGSIEEAGVSRE